MSVSTARDICRGAAQGLGAIAVGEDLDADVGTLALELLNGLMDQNAAQRLGITRVTRTTHAITANDEVYTIGASGDITSVARPVFINDIHFVDTSTSPDMELPLSMLTDDAYAAITLKALPDLYPTSAYYNPTFPNGTITLWPVPTSTTLTLVVYAPEAWTTFATLNTSFSMPPGFERYLRTWLAMELAAPLEKEPSRWLQESWREVRQVVKASNFRMQDLSVDAGSLINTGHGMYDIRSDTGG